MCIKSSPLLILDISIKGPVSLGIQPYEYTLIKIPIQIWVIKYPNLMLRVSISSLDDYEELGASRSDTCIILSGSGTKSRHQLVTCRKSMCPQPRTSQLLG